MEPLHLNHFFPSLFESLLLPPLFSLLPSLSPFLKPRPSPYLWCCYDDSSVHVALTEVLDDGEMLVGRTRRRVHHQIVQLTPVNVPQKLLDET